MKKLTEKQRFVLIVALVLLLMATAMIVFWVGSSRSVEYYYLQHVDENGFAASVNGETVFFHYPGASEELRVCNTVRVVWWDKDMIREDYTFSDAVTGAERTATMQVNEVSVRKTIPWLGEPLYG